MKEASALIRILDEQRKRHEKEDAENDAIVERLHTAYRNTVDDGWNELLAKKRLLFPERSQSDDVAVQTINLHTKSRFPKMRIGFAFALCALLVGVSFLFARTTVRPPQVFWGTIPPPRLSIVGTDTLYPFAERLFETDGMIVPAGKVPEWYLSESLQTDGDCPRRGSPFYRSLCFRERRQKPHYRCGRIAPR